MKALDWMDQGRESKQIPIEMMKRKKAWKERRQEDRRRVHVIHVTAKFCGCLPNYYQVFVGSGQVLAKKANPTVFINCSWTVHELFIIQLRRGLPARQTGEENNETKNERKTAWGKGKIQRYRRAGGQKDLSDNRKLKLKERYGHLSRRLLFIICS